MNHLQNESRYVAMNRCKRFVGKQMLTSDTHERTNTIEIISIRKNKFTNERQEWGEEGLCFYYFCPAAICFRLLVALNWWDILFIDTHLCVWCQPLRHLRTGEEGNNFSSILNDIFFLPLLSPFGLSSCSPRLQLPFIEDCLSACDTHTTNKKTHIYTNVDLHIIQKRLHEKYP